MKASDILKMRLGRPSEIRRMEDLLTPEGIEAMDRAFEALKTVAPADDPNEVLGHPIFEPPDEERTGIADRAIDLLELAGD